MDIVPEGTITASDLSGFMKTKGYCWSNEAQVYFHDSYELPVFTTEEARKFYGIEQKKKEKTDRILEKQLRQLSFLKFLYSELIYGDYLDTDDLKEITSRVETATGFDYEGKSVF